MTQSWAIRPVLWTRPPIPSPNKPSGVPKRLPLIAFRLNWVQEKEKPWFWVNRWSS